jgi:hypothetical protein
VEGYYIAAGVLVGWACLLSLIGVMREDFPGSPRATRLVGITSAVLVAATIGLAIYLSATEEHEKGGDGHAALTPWV